MSIYKHSGEYTCISKSTPIIIIERTHLYSMDTVLQFAMWGGGGGLDDHYVQSVRKFSALLLKMS